MQFLSFFFVLTTIFLHFTLAFPVSVRPQFVCRGDTRSPTEVQNVGGIQSKAEKNGKKPNWILMMHVERKYHSPEALTHDPYVSTSTSLEVCKSFLEDGNGWIYMISAGSEFIPVADSLLQFYTLKHEREWSHRGSIPWRRIISWQQYAKGKPVGELFQNSQYDTTTSQQRGGQPDYGKALTAGHSGWSIKPWKGHAPKDSWSLAYDSPQMSDEDKMLPNQHSPSLSQTTIGSSTSSLQDAGKEPAGLGKLEEAQPEMKKCGAFKGMLHSFMKLGC